MSFLWQMICRIAQGADGEPLTLSAAHMGEQIGSPAAGSAGAPKRRLASGASRERKRVCSTAAAATTEPPLRHARSRQFRRRALTSSERLPIVLLPAPGPAAPLPPSDSLGLANAASLADSARTTTEEAGAPALNAAGVERSPSADAIELPCWSLLPSDQVVRVLPAFARHEAYIRAPPPRALREAQAKKSAPRVPLEHIAVPLEAIAGEEGEVSEFLPDLDSDSEDHTTGEVSHETFARSGAASPQSTCNERDQLPRSAPAGKTIVAALQRTSGSPRQVGCGTLAPALLDEVRCSTVPPRPRVTRRITRGQAVVV